MIVLSPTIENKKIQSDIAEIRHGTSIYTWKTFIKERR